MGSEKLTKGQRAALEWVVEKPARPWNRVAKGHPKTVFLTNLMKRGLIERTETWPYERFALTDLGRSALSTTTKGVGNE